MNLNITLKTAAFDCLAQLNILDVKSAASWSCFVRIHLRKNDINEAVRTYERIARETKLTPSKFTLIKQLIKNNDYEKIQRILDVSIKVAGEELTLYDAIFSFLSLGKTEYAQKLLGAVQNLTSNRTLQVLDLRNYL